MIPCHGNTALIGAYADDDNKTDSGSVYVFTRPSVDGPFTEQSKLHASDPEGDDLFGVSVSLYGDTALIGAFYDDDDSKTNSGSVYVFTRSSADYGQFTEQSKLHASDPAVSDCFGVSVSLYGAALIGAYFNSDNSKSNSGSMYVFKAPPPPPPSPPPPSPPPSPPPLFLTSLVEYATQPKLYASDPADNDYFGVSVSLYDTALIG